MEKYSLDSIYLPFTIQILALSDLKYKEIFLKLAKLI